MFQKVSITKHSKTSEIRWSNRLQNFELQLLLNDRVVLQFLFLFRLRSQRLRPFFFKYCLVCTVCLVIASESQRRPTMTLKVRFVFRCFEFVLLSPLPFQRKLNSFVGRRNCVEINRCIGFINSMVISWHRQSATAATYTTHKCPRIKKKNGFYANEPA